MALQDIMRNSNNSLNFSDKHESVDCWVCESEDDNNYFRFNGDDKPGRIFSLKYRSQNRRITGVHECFYDSYLKNKKTRRRFSYINGKLHGFDEIYTYKGVLTDRSIWNMGVLMSKEEFFEDTGDLAKYKLFYKNGNQKKLVWSNLFTRQQDIRWGFEDVSKCDYDNYDKAEPVNLFNKENKTSVSKTFNYDNGKISGFSFYTSDNSYLYFSTYFYSGNLKSQFEFTKRSIQYFEFYSSGSIKNKTYINLKDKNDCGLEKIKLFLSTLDVSLMKQVIWIYKIL